MTFFSKNPKLYIGLVSTDNFLLGSMEKWTVSQKTVFLAMHPVPTARNVKGNSENSFFFLTIHWARTEKRTELEFLNNLWGLGTK
jgi:hypothetical protein